MHHQPAHHGRGHRSHRRAHRAAGLIAAALLLLLAGGGGPAAEEARAERVLATGDSMMYVMQQPLARRLRHLGHEAIVDGRFGTGITKPGILDWPRHAARQVAEFRPDVAVVFIGANDSWPIRGARCCGRRWTNRYARRVRRMIVTYGRSVWLTLPAPSNPRLGRIFRAVNRALRRAMRPPSVAGRATLLDLVPVFTPRWRYRRDMRWNGERVIVRQMDGVHLGHQGVKIASDLVVDALGKGA